MEMDDFVKCPFCQGLAQFRRSELRALLEAEDLREKLRANMNRLTSGTEAAQTAAGPRPGEFVDEVHHWNAGLTLWRRSAKE